MLGLMLQLWLVDCVVDPPPAPVGHETAQLALLTMADSIRSSQ